MWSYAKSFLNWIPEHSVETNNNFSLFSRWKLISSPKFNISKEMEYTSTSAENRPVRLIKGFFVHFFTVDFVTDCGCTSRCRQHLSSNESLQRRRHLHSSYQSHLASSKRISPGRVGHGLKCQNVYKNPLH